MSRDSSTPLRVATRQSPLALWQAEHVAARLADLGVKTELVPLVSGGDTDMRPIDGTRQVGLFTKRIQQALLDGEADIAVHSLKDLPTEPDERLTLAAVPVRETVEDCLVSPDAWGLTDLPQGAKIGTGSRRRAAQLRNRRPDLQVEPIRGNVQTRLAKLDAGEFDAIMLAQAGLLRLEMDDLKRVALPVEEMLPAPGQGALGIEVRADAPEIAQVVSQLDHFATRAATTAERTLLAALHGGCLAPIAALGTFEGDELTVTATVLAVDGSKRLDQTGSIPCPPSSNLTPAFTLANNLANQLIDRGARELIEQERA